MKLIFFFIHYNITIFFLHCTDISFWLITEQNNHIWFGLICHIGCHIYLLDAIFIYLTFLHSPPLVKRSNLWFLNWYNQALTGNAKTISTLPVPIPDEEKKKLNFYFHTFLWCLKRLYEGPKGFKRSRREFFIKMSWKLGQQLGCCSPLGRYFWKSFMSEAVNGSCSGKKVFLKIL